MALGRALAEEQHTHPLLPGRRRRVADEGEHAVERLREVVSAEVLGQRQGQGEDLAAHHRPLHAHGGPAERRILHRRHLFPGLVPGVMALDAHGQAQVHAGLAAALGPGIGLVGGHGGRPSESGVG